MRTAIPSRRDASLGGFVLPVAAVFAALAMLASFGPGRSDFL